MTTKLLIAILFFSIVSGFISHQDDPLQASIERGRALYEDFCINCHMAAGEGVENAFPPLAGSDYLMGKRTASIRAVKYGQEGPIEVNGKTYNAIMAPLYLEDEEVADVLNFVMNSWGNTCDSIITPEEVKNVGRE